MSLLESYFLGVTSGLGLVTLFLLLRYYYRMFCNITEDDEFEDIGKPEDF